MLYDKVKFFFQKMGLCYKLCNKQFTSIFIYNIYHIFVSKKFAFDFVRV